MRRKGRRGVPFGSRRPPVQRNSPRRSSSGRQLNPILQRELKRANHLMQNGEHLNAAQMFRQLGENSQDKGILFPAAMLYMQSATAFMLANHSENALEQASSGLELLAARQRWRAYAREHKRILQAFEDGGFGDEARQLAKLAENLPLAESEKKGNASTNNEFPSTCPYCGASLSLKQLKNSRYSVTECKYCGSIVVAGQID